MSVRCWWLVPLGLLAPATAVADNACHVVNVAFTPTDGLQIVAWVEKPDGTYVDTIYITNKTGHFGIGNRPGRFDFNSGPVPSAGHDDMWPYGRRLTTFPVWSHRHGQTFPEVIYQNGMNPPLPAPPCHDPSPLGPCGDDDLSHPFTESSPESAPPFCRPTMPGEMSWDTATCASPHVFTDKGTFSPGFASGCGSAVGAPGADGAACAVHSDCCSGVCDLGTCTSVVRYPPRADLTAMNGVDSASVAQYKGNNPFDAVAQATPLGGSCAQITWPLSSVLQPGNYVMFLEVAQEFDFNAAYNCTAVGMSWTCTQPAPCGVGPAGSCNQPGIPWSNYGQPYRGQPSVVYSVPFTVGTSDSSASAQSYIGYGDPNGVDGVLRAPDATITTDTPGTGGSRLLLLAGSSDRVRVSTRPESDALPPAAPAQLTTLSVDTSTAIVQFVAPGDDGLVGSVSGYDVRVRANDAMTADNFDTSMPVAGQVTPGTSAQNCGDAAGFPVAGTLESVALTGLMPETDYWVGVRAFDKCHNTGDLAIVHFTTPVALAGEVSACFVATAAYGTAMANDVEMLRHFRDALLHTTVVGELSVEAYYTFGPPVAGVVGESDVLRQTARDLLRPVVDRVRRMSF